MTEQFSGAQGRRRIGGALALLAALLLIVGSFLTWASAEETTLEEFDPGVPPMSVTTYAAVSGMGSVSLDLEVTGAPEGFGDVSSYLEHSASDAEDDTRMPGLWTVAFGAVLALGAVLLLTGRSGRVGAALAAFGGLGALIAAAVFLADPLGAVTVGTIGDSASDDFTAGVGLWTVLAGALFGVAAGATSVVRTRRE